MWGKTGREDRWGLAYEIFTLQAIGFEFCSVGKGYTGNQSNTERQRILKVLPIYLYHLF